MPLRKSRDPATGGPEGRASAVAGRDENGRVTAAQHPGPGPASDDPDEVVRSSAYADRLADAVDASLEDWVVHCVEVRASDAGIERRRRTSGRCPRRGGEVSGRGGDPGQRQLFDLDIDEQPTTPLTILRGAVYHPTAVLGAQGVAVSPRGVRRDQLSRRRLRPGTGDVRRRQPGPRAIPGLRWGAAKAHVHLKRRRAAGQR